MSAKKRTPVKGGIVIVKHENSEETYYFDGVNLIDTTGKRFTPFNVNEEKIGASYGRPMILGG